MRTLIPTCLRPQSNAREFTCAPATRHTAHHERVAFRVSEAEVAAARPLPQVPIVVVSRGDAHDTGSADRKRLWRRLQQEFVDAHPGSVQFGAGKKGHYIQLQQPPLVICRICVALERAHVDTGGDLPVPPASLHQGTTR